MISFFALSEIRDIAQQFYVLAKVVRHLAVVASFEFAALLEVVEKCFALNQGCLVHFPIVPCWALADVNFGCAANISNTKNVRKGSSGTVTSRGFVAPQTSPPWLAFHISPFFQFCAIPNFVEQHRTLWFLSFGRCIGCLV